MRDESHLCSSDQLCEKNAVIILLCWYHRTVNEDETSSEGLEKRGVPRWLSE